MTDRREYSLYQVLVLCGTHDRKHPEVLAEATGKHEKIISGWSTRGVPCQFWGVLVKHSGLQLTDVVDAHARALDKPFHEEMQRYLAAVRGVDKETC